MEQDKSRLGPEVPSTREGYEQILNRLRESGIVDVDALRSASVSEPMGPSRDCLSADDILEYIEGEHIRPLTEKVNQFRLELAVCENCRDNLAIYRAIFEPVPDPAVEEMFQRIFLSQTGMDSTDQQSTI